MDRQTHSTPPRQTATTGPDHVAPADPLPLQLTPVTGELHSPTRHALSQALAQAHAGVSPVALADEERRATVDPGPLLPGNAAIIARAVSDTRPTGPTEPVYRAARARYLERKATPTTFNSTAERIRRRFTCHNGPRWAVVGVGHERRVTNDQVAVAKTVLCGREWCPTCGAEGSDMHMRRVSRWLPKALQISELGYLVLTVPPGRREALADRRELGRLGRRVTELMKRNGFKRGLRRWHHFGDQSDTFNPHMNVIIDCGFMPPETLERIKRGWRRILKIRCRCADHGLGCKCVDVHYEYRQTAAEKMHTLKYVSRATFLNVEWDELLAEELEGFRNSQSWGKWDGSPVWEAPEGEAPGRELVAMVAGMCPCGCGEPLKWQGVVPAKMLPVLEYQDVGGGFWIRHTKPPTGQKRTLRQGEPGARAAQPLVSTLAAGENGAIQRCPGRGVSGGRGGP